MIPSILINLVVAVSSVVVVNGAAIQRDGAFTYMTPQPTSPLQTSGTTTAASSTPTTYPTTVSTPSVTYPTTTPTPSVTYPSTVSTTSSTYPTTSSTPTYPTTTSIPTTTYPTTSTPAMTYPTTTSTLTTQSVSTETSIPVTSPIHSSVYGVPPTMTPTLSSTPNITYPTTVVSTAQSSGQPSVTPMSPTKVTKSVPPVSSPSVPASSITPTPTPTLCTGTVSCDGVQQWQVSFAYDAGDRVIFDNQLWTATQWTYDNAPPMHPDQWTCVGLCAQPIKNDANCSGVAAWQGAVAYVAGNTVTFNGSLWSAVQWTQSNSPGDTSGVWQDLGACA